jgi:hypothetical protein
VPGTLANVLLGVGLLVTRGGRAGLEGAWYAGTRAKVEARAALEQAAELGRVLEELGKGLQ